MQKHPPESGGAKNRRENLEADVTNQPQEKRSTQTLKKALDDLGDPRVITEVIAEKADIGKVIRSFLSMEEKRGTGEIKK